uniref:Secreted protein n=1 Tax=Trichogramma kaykai TaxID=54128 RepID=A0ABD2W371_9HYME
MAEEHCVCLVLGLAFCSDRVHQTHRSAEATSRPWSAAPPSTMVHDDDDNNNNERRHREGFVLITESQLDKGGGVGVRVTVVCSTESRDAE